MRDWRKIKRNTKRKRAGCLNRYEFAYTGRNAVNTALTTFKKVAPSLIETTTNQVDKKCNSIFAWTETKTIVKKIVKKGKTCKAGGTIDNWLNGKKAWYI